MLRPVLGCIPSTPRDDTVTNRVQLHSVPGHVRRPPSAVEPEPGSVREVCSDDDILVATYEHTNDRSQVDWNRGGGILHRYQEACASIDYEKLVRLRPSPDSRSCSRRWIPAFESSRPRLPLLRDDSQYECYTRRRQTSITPDERIVGANRRPLREGLHDEGGGGVLKEIEDQGSQTSLVRSEEAVCITSVRPDRDGRTPISYVPLIVSAGRGGSKS